MTRNILIIGAGAAGLSLACAMIRRGLDGDRLHLVEPRTAYVRDRTWCFWDVDPLPPMVERAVSRRWPRWTIRASGQEVTGEGRYRYCCVPSDRFYASALEELRATSGVTISLGRRVESLERPSGGRVVARLDDGAQLEADRVFDSRPRAIWGAPSEASPVRPGEVRMLQHFVGQEVEVEAPLFDVSCATLMDFDVDQSRGLHFIYVLPMSSRRALIESTAFGPETFPERVYLEAIERYLRDRIGAREHRVLMTERGVLPMTTERLSAPEGGVIHPIGLRGGLAKPSTGYAFLNILRSAEALADRLAASRSGATFRAPRPRSAWTGLLDHAFMSYLAERPERGPKLFLQLMQRNDPDTLVRFLSERSTLPEELSVMLSLPRPRLVLHAARAAAHLLRREATTPLSPPPPR